MSIQPGPGYTFSSSGLGTALNIQHPWAPWTTYATQIDDHPFKIINAQLVTAGGSSTIRYQVKSGTLNNLVPLIDNFSTGTTVKLDAATTPTAQLTSVDYYAPTKTAYITLRAGPSLSTGNYPDEDDTTSRYPLVRAANDPATPDSDAWGFLVIGSITVDDTTTPTTFTVNQNVTGSLWADRLKVGTQTARYYYARI